MSELATRWWASIQPTWCRACVRGSASLYLTASWTKSLHWRGRPFCTQHPSASQSSSGYSPASRDRTPARLRRTASADRSARHRPPHPPADDRTLASNDPGTAHPTHVRDDGVYSPLARGGGHSAGFPLNPILADSRREPFTGILQLGQRLFACIEDGLDL